jgi:hypothetical protein
MRFIKLALAVLIFLVSVPLSWYGAWVAGYWGTVILSVLIPTYGIIYWALFQVMGHGFMHSLLSVVLGLAGAIVSMVAMRVLAPN